MCLCQRTSKCKDDFSLNKVGTCKCLIFEFISQSTIEMVKSLRLPIYGFEFGETHISIGVKSVY